MPLRHLFIDMNAFFASVEQQDKPHLRDKPVAVVPTNAETTSCIAACYRAKAHGVRTGTPVWQARKMCPELVCVVADHKRYVIVHNRIVAAVERVLPIESVRSIDEVACRLVGAERHPDAVIDLAHRIKRAIYELAGAYMHCSIGAGPNVMLAKVAADMRKPNGLTILSDDDVPRTISSSSLM